MLQRQCCNKDGSLHGLAGTKPLDNVGFRFFFVVPDEGVVWHAMPCPPVDGAFSPTPAPGGKQCQSFAFFQTAIKSGVPLAARE